MSKKRPKPKRRTYKIPSPSPQEYQSLLKEQEFLDFVKQYDPTAIEYLPEITQEQAAMFRQPTVDELLSNVPEGHPLRSSNPMYGQLKDLAKRKDFYSAKAARLDFSRLPSGTISGKPYGSLGDVVQEPIIYDVMGFSDDYIGSDDLQRGSRVIRDPGEVPAPRRLGGPQEEEISPMAGTYLGPSKTEGYQYKKGRPAPGSITKRRSKAMR